jgi:hypothetical protein
MDYGSLKKSLLLDCLADRAGTPLSLHQAAYVLGRGVAEIRESVLLRGAEAGVISNGGEVIGVHRSFILGQLPMAELRELQAPAPRHLHMRTTW